MFITFLQVPLNSAHPSDDLRNVAYHAVSSKLSTECLFSLKVQKVSV